MNLEQILFAIVNVDDEDIPVDGLKAAKENWLVFYPALESLIDQFIADDSSLSKEQQTILYYGTLLLAELKYTPALAKVLQLFKRRDTFLTPIEDVFGDALTELTATLFYNIAGGNIQALSDYIVDGHQAMYCKAAAIEAVFAQYEAGNITQSELCQHISRWLAAFLVIPNLTNSFLLSVLAHMCIGYQLDQYKAKFISLCGNSLFDEDRCSEVEIKSWDINESYKLIESGLVQPEFSVVNTLNSWMSEQSSSETAFENSEINEIEQLMAENGALANMLYDEQVILDNSVPVSRITKVGRNDPCLCGSGKKYKKCCLVKLH